MSKKVNTTTIKKLDYVEGECIVSELSTKDLIQLGSRYLNDICVYLKNMVHLQLRTEKLLTFIAEDKGIDVKECFREDAKKMLAEQEQLQKALKEQLENIKK